MDQAVAVVVVLLLCFALARAQQQSMAAAVTHAWVSAGCRAPVLIHSPKHKPVYTASLVRVRRLREPAGSRK